MESPYPATSAWVSSVDPSSTTINSKSRYVCDNAESIVFRRNRSQLNVGMMTETRGMDRCTVARSALLLAVRPTLDRVRKALTNNGAEPPTSASTAKQSAVPLICYQETNW